MLAAGTLSLLSVEVSASDRDCPSASTKLPLSNKIGPGASVDKGKLTDFWSCVPAPVKMHRIGNCSHRVKMHLSKIAYISLVVREHLDPRTCIVIGALQTHRCGIHQAVNNPSRSTASCVPAVFSCSYESR